MYDLPKEYDFKMQMYQKERFLKDMTKKHRLTFIWMLFLNAATLTLSLSYMASIFLNQKCQNLLLALPSPTSQILTCFISITFCLSAYDTVILCIAWHRFTNVSKDMSHADLPKNLDAIIKEPDDRNLLYVVIKNNSGKLRKHTIADKNKPPKVMITFQGKDHKYHDFIMNATIFQKFLNEYNVQLTKTET